MTQIRVKMLIEYDGTAFYGWQYQPEARSVQGDIQAVLEKLCGRSVTITGSGRTDSGVHALGQVAHADIEKEELKRVRSGLPAMLPTDVTVHSVEEVDDSFHARHDAVSRLYRYRIEREKHPLKNRYCHTLPPSYQLDTVAMDKAAELSIGNNSWKAMAKEGSSNSDWMVNVMEASVEEDESGWTFTIRANRFLRGMVRLWVGTLMKIGSGSFPPQLMTRLLKSEDRSDAGISLPGRGLTLVEVCYS